MPNALQIFQGMCAAALLWRWIYSVLASSGQPETRWSMVSSKRPHSLHYYCYYYYYHYCLVYHSLCWCSFCASAERKPCTWSISHSSQSFCLHTKHLSEDSRRSQHANLLNLCHSSCLWYFLDVSYLPFFTVPSALTTTWIIIIIIINEFFYFKIIIIIIIIIIWNEPFFWWNFFSNIWYFFNGLIFSIEMKCPF